MTPRQKTVIRETWQQVVPIAGQAAALFYDRLFEIDPKLRALFAATDMAAQHTKLVEALSAVVGALDRIEDIVPVLETLGRRHAGYGVRDSDYGTVGEALLWTLEKGLSDSWTDEAASAWTAAYALVAGVMRGAAAQAAGQPSASAAPVSA